jgi:hypothetical protein
MSKTTCKLSIAGSPSNKQVLAKAMVAQDLPWFSEFTPTNLVIEVYRRFLQMKNLEPFPFMKDCVSAVTASRDADF